MSWAVPWTAHLGLRGPDAPLFRHSARSADPFDQIDFIADLGLAGVQDNYAALRPADEQERVAAHAARRGLRLASFVHDPLGWDQPRWSAPDEDGRAALLAELDRSLATARRIGGHTLICVAGLDPARPRAAQLAAMAENLRRAGDRAGAAGVRLCVEMTSARWLPSMLVDRFDDAVAVVRAAGHPAVRLMFDVGHIALDGIDPLSALAAAEGLIGAVQVADVPADGSAGRIDIGAGRIDWPALIRAIRATGYDGLFEIEHEALGEGLAGEQALIERLRAVDRAAG
ncbi:sugar phosphate isomerase/epimerase family protein [Edaphosphingomonas haloaromaticamans]|uniref:Xylose isomerase-like TIM barrel n=1 Tax=Edaphosphingomonas haloaromaticamans TaxID=653954 RepID=A0A1S1HHB6_9SPHN|nr:sugar phosphate isomerase/epimerase family protein [Sphingomonas haloaromaticamans]OHT21222.1 Xylose isomerase-like TIM barrel [Sphingomonas haloaromaticamans]